MQGEQEKHELRTHLFEWMFDPQPLTITDISVFEFNGGWDPCSHKPVDRSHLREAGAAIPTMCGDAFETGPHKCASFLHEAWARKSKAFVSEIVVDTAGDAQTVVCGG